MSWEKWTPVELPNHRVWRISTLQGLNYIQIDEVRDWLHEHAGKKAEFLSSGPKGQWHRTYPISADTTTYYFEDPKVAVLFKLTFGGA